MINNNVDEAFRFHVHTLSFYNFSTTTNCEVNEIPIAQISRNTTSRAQVVVIASRGQESRRERERSHKLVPKALFLARLIYSLCIKNEL